MEANRKYHFSVKRAKEINDNSKLIKEEALKMKEAFDKQGNQEHTLEGSHIYSNSLLLEKVFYEQVVPEFKKL